MPPHGIEPHPQAPPIIIAGPIRLQQQPINDNHEQHKVAHLRWLNKVLDPRRRQLSISRDRDDPEV